MNDTPDLFFPDNQPEAFCKQAGEPSICEQFTPRPRKCLLKTCGKQFHPLCGSQTYCCIPCMMMAEQWEQACERLKALMGQDEKKQRRQESLQKAGKKYNQSEKGREKKRLQAQRRRDRDKAAKEAARAAEQQARQNESGRSEPEKEPETPKTPDKSMEDCQLRPRAA